MGNTYKTGRFNWTVSVQALHRSNTHSCTASPDSGRRESWDGRGRSGWREGGSEGRVRGKEYEEGGLGRREGRSGRTDGGKVGGSWI